jgi:hypothetical protein
MKKHILIEHLVVCCRWESANVAFDFEETYQKESIKISAIGYGGITEHFGSSNPYKKDDAQQKNFMEDLSSCLWPKLICLFLLLKVSD